MSKPTSSPPSFAALVQAYFAEYLTQQRALSAQTIAAYPSTPATSARCAGGVLAYQRER